ncbi:hypothetical protein [Myxococcus sp. RHSTA-1-4]|uniref:hypothetical protein n=1 Tax=Myxococcus sp. RHSTA-1-4 TaxID=2874601 RepID=UPI001CBE28EF|nr:hypothetical protein [Myxococcus sp. RHSTA-1-4]MBZ4416098.1 hypothetical protein [Myxococcus sp. RHSTA-1-4]
MNTLHTQTNTSGCKKALNIAEVVSFNEETLPPEVLCSTPAENFRVVYNGTTAMVFSRLRNHTATTEKGPFSIGLNFYPDLVKEHRWSARIFHIGMIDGIEGLTADEKRVFKELGTQHARSRVAVEMAWRMRYGWPLFNQKGLEDRKRTGAPIEPGTEG